MTATDQLQAGVYNRVLSLPDPEFSSVANWLSQLFGSRNQRLINGYSKYVSRTNALESTFKALSDEQLRAKTDEFRARLAKDETLYDILAEALAAAREAARRTLGMRHFDVQLIGGMAL